MALLDEQGRGVELGAHVTGVAWLGGTAACALGDGTVRFLSDGQMRVFEAHLGACLSVAVPADGLSLLTGGDDGRLVRTSLWDGPTALAEVPGKWIDLVAAGPAGALAYASAKRVFTRTDRLERTILAPSSAGGLTFAPKGLRLAVAHYGGVTLHWVGTEGGEETFLPWKGSHMAVTWSPDGRFIVTAMQENALHGWRIADRQNMRMAGYPSRIRSLSWTAKGRWLATSGAEGVILWPFQGKDGPMGQSARELGVRAEVSTATACHPNRDVVAAGYRDGLVLLVRIEDGAELVASAPGGGAVTSIAWSPGGDRLAFGTEGGRLGVLRV